MSEAMVLMVLNRKCGFIWLWSILSSMDVASLRCVSISAAAIWVESSLPKPKAMDFCVSVMRRALRKYSFSTPSMLSPTFSGMMMAALMMVS